MTSDIDTALVPKPFVYSRFHRKAYKREWMRRRRADPQYYAKELETNRERARQLKLAAALSAHIGAD